MSKRRSTQSQSSSTGSRTSPHCSNSDRPSATASRRVLHERIRSVLCHPLCLPLTCSFHGMDPDELDYFGRASTYREFEEQVRNIFGDSIKAWNDGIEAKLTEALADKISEKFEFFNFKALKEVRVQGGKESESNGRIDIILTQATTQKTKDKSTPLAVIEFGLSNKNWWQKFDQGIKYVDRMRVQSNQLPYLQFDKPLLLAVMTYNAIDCQQDDKSIFRIGVFLCSRKNTTAHELDGYRMSLLWHTKSISVEDASNVFGRFLRVTADFQQWRDDGQSVAGYEYFSSNCCRVGQENDGNAVMLRSYDNRFRKTNRSPAVYLSPDCSKVVGDLRTIVEIPGVQDEAEPAECHKNERFWYRSGRNLLIIAVPYRRGSHVATSPGAFLPIIDQLGSLHKEGFVHGDIRAFNTVFGKKKSEGWLIDFDFGGKVDRANHPKGHRAGLVDGLRLGHGDDEARDEDGEVPVYPEGYRSILVDGHRRGKAKSRILKSDDWYALGKLIFAVHRIDPPTQTSRGSTTMWKRLLRNISVLLRRRKDTGLRARKDLLAGEWMDLSQDGPSDQMIEELKKFLGELDELGWTAKAADPIGLILANYFGNDKYSSDETRGHREPAKEIGGGHQT